jgi:hypothetical protein
MSKINLSQTQVRMPDSIKWTGQNTASWRRGLSLIALTNGAPRDRCRIDGFRGGEGTGTTGKPRPRIVASGGDLDFHKRNDGTATGRSPWNRMWDLGSGVFVAWRSRLAHRRPALFRRLDEHARRLGANAATTLADDGRPGGSRRGSAIWCECGVYFRSHAGVLFNARARNPEQRLTREDP